MRMLSYKKPLYWAMASLLSSGIALALFIASWEFYHFLLLGYVFFTIASVVLAVVAIVYIILKKRNLIGVLQLIVLISAGVFIQASVPMLHDYYRIRRASTYNRLIEVRELKYLISEYIKQNGYFPDPDNWFDLLERRDKGFYVFPPMSEPKCNFAFNKNLSHLSADSLQGNKVVLFEADGELNLSGGPELISKERAKDRYFVFKKQIFIYILFVDGTIVKYRLHDGAVALYEPGKDEFTGYRRKGETPYSPLKWK